MIQRFVDHFLSNKDKMKADFKASHPSDYKDVVHKVMSCLRSAPGTDYRNPNPDPKRITEINAGSYQGTLVYVIAATGSSPDDFWYVRVGYGSCSGCDTLEAIRGYKDEPPTDAQADQYWTLALHVVQNLKKMDGEVA
jgi:hypothetical protein